MASLGTFREQSLGSILSGLLPTLARERSPGLPGLMVICCASMIVFSLLLGGGTRGGFLSDVILELFSIPAFLFALSSLIDLPWRRMEKTDRAHWVLAFCCLIMLVPLIQLIPLPPPMWTRLPGREAVAAVFDLLGGRRPWMPISVAPNATWMSVLSLLPPMAIFLGVVQLGYRERRALTLVILAVGVVSVFVGLTQVAQGPTSPLRFFTITNDTEAVGFFANRNHFAALLYAVLLFAAAWAIDIAFKSGPLTDIRSFEPARIIALTAIFMVLIVLIAGEAMARSRAGIVLTIVALAGVFAMAFADRRNASGLTPSKLLLGATILAVILVVQFGLYRILDRFAVDPLEDARIPFAHNTIEAAKAFMPLGAGLGTFVPVYAMFEKPSDTFANIYANHAHNDILELWLETGVVGPILVGLLVIWAGLSAARLWRRPPANASELDRSLIRAATMAIGLLIVHSFVDYPLRTGAMMAVFAFSCALLIEPWGVSADTVQVEAKPRRGGVPRKAAESLARTAVALRTAAGASAVAARGTEVLPLPLRQPAERWGEEIDWPEEWRKSSGPKRPAEGDDQSKPKR